MKIKNTTSFPTEFIRRMAGWVCREIGLPSTGVKLQVGRKVRTQGWSGVCCGRRVVVNIHPRICTTKQLVYLVEGLGHELFHSVQYRENLLRHPNRRMSVERSAVFMGYKVRDTFLADREKLLIEWAK